MDPGFICGHKLLEEAKLSFSFDKVSGVYSWPGPRSFGTQWADILQQCNVLLLFSLPWLWNLSWHWSPVVMVNGLIAPHKRCHIFFLFLHKNIKCGELRKNTRKNVPYLQLCGFPVHEVAFQILLATYKLSSPPFHHLLYEGHPPMLYVFLDLHECWVLVTEVANDCMMADVSTVSEITDTQCWTLKPQISRPHFDFF